MGTNPKDFQKTSANGINGSIFSVNINEGASTADMNNALRGMAGVVAAPMDLGDAAEALKTDQIAESTTDAGVTIDGLNIKDGGIPGLSSGGTHGAVVFYDSSGDLVELAPGTAGEVLNTNGAGADPSWGTGSQPPTTQIFTASGTWNRPTGCVTVDVTVVGPGGGGGGSSNNNGTAGGGGGAGGTARALIDVSGIATSTITVGTGGGGGSGTGNGSQGSSASVWADGTNTLTGGAGDGGAQGQGSAGLTAGGTATGGDININGQDGAERGSHTFSMHNGEGGDSTMGQGGRVFFDANGSQGTGYGSGGAGGDRNTGPARTGAAGQDGICIVVEYYG